MAVYLPMGHGFEEFDEKEHILPDNCSFISLETCGGARKAFNTDTLEHTQLREFVRDYSSLKELKDIFINSKKSDIHNLLGPVSIYAKKTHPNMNYTFPIDWKGRDDIRYSGIITLESYLSDEFTTTNIYHEFEKIEVRHILVMILYIMIHILKIMPNCTNSACSLHPMILIDIFIMMETRD